MLAASARSLPAGRYPARRGDEDEKENEREGGNDIMKKIILVICVMFTLAISLGACATRGDLEAVEAREKAMAAKADQAAQDAADARMSADEAITKANEAMARAEEAEKRANEREAMAAEKERMAEEKAKEAEMKFQKSMKK
jgi:murein lipoprotein